MELRELLVQNPLLLLLGKSAKPQAQPPVQELRAPALLTRRISVVIPAHNEEGYLQRTLSAVQKQNYDWYEIIVVANGCYDRTVPEARGRCHRLIIVSQKNLGLARNLGARMAQGDLLLFLDADTTLEPMALRRIAQDFNRHCAAGTMRGRPSSMHWKYRLIYALKNLLHQSSLHTGSSGVIICWKDHFIQAGGFDEGLEVRENSDLIKRLRRFGKYKYFDDICATTSMRRYEQRGFGRVVWLWFRLWFHSLWGDLHQRRYETVR